jgi:hypothetical protein
MLRSNVAFAAMSSFYMLDTEDFPLHAASKLWERARHPFSCAPPLTGSVLPALNLELKLD